MAYLYSMLLLLCYHKRLAHIQHYGESARCKNAERRNECSIFDTPSVFYSNMDYAIEGISTPYKAGHRSLPKAYAILLVLGAFQVEFLGFIVHLGWVLGHLRSINLDT